MSPEAQVQGARQSRVGKRPIPVPKGVSVSLSGQRVDVQGPKGKLSQELPAGVVVKKDGDVLVISTDAAPRDARRLQGLARALVASMVQGANSGFQRILELVGTGYRCEVAESKVTLLLGYSHPCVVELPQGVSAEVPKDSKGTQLVMTSADKAKLGQVAATIRGLRPPEPYGGKGVRYRGEQIRRKAGKAGKGRTK